MKKILFAAPHIFNGPIMVGAQQYAKEFSRKNWDVAYVSNFLSIFNILFSKNKNETRNKINNFLRGGIRYNKFLWTYVPFTLVPHHNNSFFDKKWFFDNYSKFTIPHIQHIIKKEGFESVDVLWIDSTVQSFWINRLKFKILIYRVYDDINIFSNTGKIVREYHEKFITNSDIVLVTSKILFNELKNKFKDSNLIYCPNGVDLNNFVREYYEEPEEFKHFDCEKVLFVGAIDEWFDIDLIKFLANNSKRKKYFIIGPDKTGLIKNLKNDNIIYLGTKNYDLIPNYINSCDFGIIPFKSNELIRCINPIKMYEFFILGKPVISTWWDELQELNSPIYLAKNYSEFLELVNDDKKYKNEFALINYAKSNTWENRFNFISNILANYI